MILFWALLIAFATVGLCVIVHYEALRLTSLFIPRLTIPPRPKVLVVIAAVFLAHLAEIVIFAVTYRLMQPFPQLGEIAGHFSRSAVDYFYFSITSFTTLGIGDLFPHGAYRIVVGFESLTGFGLIGWSVSFTYLVMQEFWTQHGPRPKRKIGLDGRLTRGSLRSPRSASMPNINLEAVLLEALDDERKAEATYGAVIEKFGEVRPFINIIEAERRHSAAIERQMTRLGFAIPANQWQGKGMAPATLAEACRMAIEAEVENIALYDRLLPAIADASVRHVLQNLQDASRDNHLPAFRRCLERENGGGGSGGARDGQGSQGRHGRGRGPRGGCST